MVLTLKLTLIHWTSKTTDCFKRISTVIWQHWMPKYMRNLLPPARIMAKAVILKLPDLCDLKYILHVTLIAKTLTGYGLLLTLILAKSLTVDPYNCWPLNMRMSVLREMRKRGERFICQRSDCNGFPYELLCTFLPWLAELSAECLQQHILMTQLLLHVCSFAGLAHLLVNSLYVKAGRLRFCVMAAAP